MEDNATQVKKPKKKIKNIWHDWVYGENNSKKIPLASFDKNVYAQIMKCVWMAAVILLCMVALCFMTKLWALLLVGIVGICVPGARALNIYRIVQQDRCYYVEGVISNIGVNSFIHDTTFIEIKTESSGVLRINYIGKKPQKRMAANNTQFTNRIRFNVGDAVRLYYDKNTRLTDKDGVIILQEYITLVNARPAVSSK